MIAGRSVIAGLFIMLADRKQLAKSTLETEDARGGALWEC